MIVRTRRATGADLALLGAALLLTLLLLEHARVPDILGLGTVLDCAAPWLGIGIPVLVLVAFACRSRIGAVAAVIPLLAWAYLFGSWWAGTGSNLAAADRLTVVTQNMYAGNDSPSAAVRSLAATGADLIALQECSSGNRESAAEILSSTHPYHAAEGTVALWSRYPLSGTGVADVGAGWRRGLRTHVDTPTGDLVVYVVHLPSIRLGDTADRNRGLRTLSRELASDPARRIVVLGDFNTTGTDRHWAGFAPGYRDIRTSGAQFTWPAVLPVVGPDHILTRGLAPVSSATIRTPGADHRGLVAVLAVPRSGQSGAQGGNAVDGGGECGSVESAVGVGGGEGRGGVVALGGVARGAEDEVHARGRRGNGALAGGAEGVE
ncbi:endonuclease/exonuclease/phosphatase family protein [Nocardia terpenica]